MTSSKSYLLRALFEWIVDNDCTPYILVDATAAGVEVPQAFVKDGQIVLNISPSAVKHFVLDESGLGFNARFSGVATDIYSPMHAIMGIYAKENGKGMMFEREEPPGPPDPLQPQPTKDREGKNKAGDSGKSTRPSLRVIK